MGFKASKKREQAFYLADDASRSAYLEPVWCENRSAEAWCLLGETNRGGRRLLDRLVTGLAQGKTSVLYFTVGTPPTNDEAYLLPSGEQWRIWWAGKANTAQPRWLDGRIHYKLVLNALQSWAQTFSNSFQASRMMSSPELTSYLEALWPLIASQPTWASAYEKCSWLLDVGTDVNLYRFRSYLESTGRLSGDWSFRLSRALGTRQFAESLSLLWEFLRQWMQIESGKPLLLEHPGHWFCLFPQHFAAGVAYAIELVLASIPKPGLIVLDRIGELLPPEIYMEQVQRLKRNGWTIVLAEPNLTWVERGDEGETWRLASLVDNWLFGTLDGSTAAILERSLRVEQPSQRISSTRRLGFGTNASNSLTESSSYEAAIPIRIMTALPFSQAVLFWKHPPAFEVNRFRLLSLDS